MLLILIFLPLLGGVLSWLASKLISRRFDCLLQLGNDDATTETQLHWLTKCKLLWLHSSAVWITGITMVIELILIGYYWYQCLASFHSTHKNWSVETNVEWIPFLGIEFHLLLDGLSILFVLLALFLASFTVFYSYKEKIANNGLFYFFILWSISAMIGLLTAVDLFLFFLFWEMLTIPIYFLIVLWGRRDSNAQLRFNGAIRLVIFGQLSGLLMLISIVSLALINFTHSGKWTFDYAVLINTAISSYVEFFLMFGFLFAFIVRLPLVPFHGWFINAHIESSTTSSILISGLVTNTAIYGILRFAIPIFPNASITIAPIMVIIGLCSMYYAALLIFGQSDIKKLIAYVHTALMSFLFAMVYMGNSLTYQGIIIQSMGISILITGLFTVSGLLIARYQTRNINKFVKLGGVVNYLPAFTMFFVLTTVGIPGTANFVGNIMLVINGFEQYPLSCALLLIGLLLASIAMLIRMQPIFYGLPACKRANFSIIYKPLSIQDRCLLIMLIISLLVIGIYPQIILDTSYPVIEKVTDFWKNSQVISFKETA